MLYAISVVCMYVCYVYIKRSRSINCSVIQFNWKDIISWHKQVWPVTGSHPLYTCSVSQVRRCHRCLTRTASYDMIQQDAPFVKRHSRGHGALCGRIQCAMSLDLWLVSYECEQKLIAYCLQLQCKLTSYTHYNINSKIYNKSLKRSVKKCLQVALKLWEILRLRHTVGNWNRPVSEKALSSNLVLVLGTM